MSDLQDIESRDEDEERFGCPKCAANLKGDEPKCPECGQVLLGKAGLRCPVCTTPVSKRRKKCPNCSSSLDGLAKQALNMVPLAREPSETSVTDSMQRAMSETNRRRERQLADNLEHGIEPATIRKTREEILAATAFADSRDKTAEELQVNKPQGLELPPLGDQIDFLTQAMKEAARDLKFERAAKIRDEIKALKEKQRSDKQRVRKLPR